MEEFSSLYCKMKCLLMKWEDLVQIIKDKKLKEAENIIDCKVIGKQMTITDYQIVLLGIYHNFKKIVKGTKAFYIDHKVCSHSTLDIVSKANQSKRSADFSISNTKLLKCNSAYSKLPEKGKYDKCTTDSMIPKYVFKFFNKNSSEIDNFITKKKAYGERYVLPIITSHKSQLKPLCDLFPSGQSVSIFQYPAFYGLQDTADASHINCVLQVLKSCYPFAYYINNDDFRPFHKNRLVSNFMMAMRSMWLSTATYDAKDFLNTLLNKYPYFNDKSSIFQSITALLELFHNSVNTKPFSTTLNQKSFVMDKIISMESIGQMLNAVSGYENSIVYDMFTNVGINEFVCPKCNLSIAKYKWSIGITANIDNNSCVIDAIQGNYTARELDGYKCNGCNQTVTIKAIYNLLVPAPILIVGINRKKTVSSIGSMVIDNKEIELEDMLDISKILYNKTFIRTPKYKLVSTVNYTGSLSSGFYWCQCYDAIQKKWKKINGAQIEDSKLNNSEFCLLAYIREDLYTNTQYNDKLFLQLKMETRFITPIINSIPEPINGPKTLPLQPNNKCKGLDILIHFLCCAYPFSYAIVNTNIEYGNEYSGCLAKAVKNLFSSIWSGKIDSTLLSIVDDTLTKTSGKCEYNSAGLFKSLASILNVFHQSCNEGNYSNSIPLISFRNNTKMSRREIATELYRITKFHDSIVYDLFCCLQIKSNKCLECQQTISQYSNSLFLICESEPSGSIVEALIKSNTSLESVKCPICTGKNSSKSNIYIISPPPILLLYFRDSPDNTKSSPKIEKEIDISPLMYSINTAISTKYILCSAIKIQNQAISMISFDLWTRQWREVDDGISKGVNTNSVQFTNAQVFMYLNESIASPIAWTPEEMLPKYRLLSRSKLH